MESLNKQKKEELNHHNTNLLHIKNNARIKTLTRFNFLPDPSQTNHMNMRLVLGNTPPNDYFSISNLAFHDLTTGNILPQSANTLLGLGLKYIPTPRINTSPDEQDKSLSRFERDFSLKVFFAGDTEESSSVNTTLRVKSTWIPPLPPREIDTRIMRFCQSISTSFVERTTISNLSTAQQSLLNTIRRNPEVTIAPADKNLGPVGVNTKQYIEWGLKHLQDESTYETLSEAKALSDVRKLCKEIYDWTRQHRKNLPTR
jgi:hypothetical protein